jgi:hypothetical protein
MPRYALLALAVVSVALIAAGVVVSHKLTAGPAGAKASATPTPTISVPPPKRPVQHGIVHLAANYKNFVNLICGALARHEATPLENHLIYYQANEGVYWSPFNRAEGNFASADTIRQWLTSGHERCVRLSPSFLGHGVLASKGWTLDGGWALFDLDKQPGTGAWTIDDFTFGTYRQVMGSFYGNEHRSVAYHSKA